MALSFTRRSDQNIPHDKEKKKAIDGARQFIKKKNYIQAAHLYETAGLHRNAISVLEDHGLIKEAAGVLIRLQNFSRAGFLYARNKYYQEAMTTFKKAQMPLEAATAARAGQLYKEAAKLFLKAQLPLPAAQCLIKQKDFLGAARCFAMIKKWREVSQCYKLVSRQHSKNPSSYLTDQDRHHIFFCLTNGDFSSDLFKLMLNSRNYFPRLIIQLCHQNQVKALLYMLKLAQKNDLNDLISKINYGQPYAKSLAEYLAQSHHMRFAGYIWERSGDLSRAATAFEQAKDYKRAITLYHRTGNSQAIEALKARVKKKEPLTQKPTCLPHHRKRLNPPLKPPLNCIRIR